MSNEIELAHYYRKFNTTPMLEQDIKLIQRMNVVIGKFQKTRKLAYLFEAINIIHTLNNYILISDVKNSILNFLDTDNRVIATFILDNVNDISLTKLRDAGLIE